MNEFQLESLQDYIKEPTAMNMELFTASINPSYKISKSNQPKIKALINKYTNDNSKSRLDAIVNLIQPIPIQPLLSQEMIDNFNKNKINSKNGNNLISDISSYRKVLPGAELERKTSIFTSLFGDWNIEGSLSYSLINKLNPVARWTFNDNEMLDSRNFANKTIMQPELVIKWTEELTGKRIINFYDIHINSVFMPGNLSSCTLILNKLNDFRIINNNGYDAASAQLKGYNTINPNVPMQDAFKGLEGVRLKMKAS